MSIPSRKQHGRTALCQFANDKKDSAVSETHKSPLPPHLMIDMAAFGDLVKERRLNSGLTQRLLAKSAELSEPTVRNIEHKRRAPSDATLCALIKALQIKPEDLPVVPRPASADSAQKLDEHHCFVAPDYEAFKLWLEFRKHLNSSDGHIEQTYLYLESENALNYLQMTYAATYMAMFRKSMPLEAIAQQLIAYEKGLQIDIISLGSGDGHQETQLVSFLAALAPEKSYRFFLLDVSQPLLNSGYVHASNSLKEHLQETISITAIQGNFHYLSDYNQLFNNSTKHTHRRIFTMMGCTFSMLDSELHFFKHSLGNTISGDLFLFDFVPVASPCDDREAIYASDHALRSPIPEEHAKWLSGSLRRYLDGYRSHSFRMELRQDCEVLGSYALDAVATVLMTDGSVREISVARFKRHDGQLLARSLSELGWDCLDIRYYGGLKKPTAGLLIACKR